MRDTSFMRKAADAALDSKCSRRKVGAIAVRHNRTVLASGYNGTPSGFPNCIDGGCPRCAGNATPGVNYHICLCVHAEMNVIFNAASEGISLGGTTVYSTLMPCLPCLLALYQVGVKRLVYRDHLELDSATLEPYLLFRAHMFDRGVIMERFQE